MPYQSIGKLVNTGATPKRLTSGQTDPTKCIECYSITVQALFNNTGKIYIGSLSNMDSSTLVGVLFVLPIPTANYIPHWTHSFVNAQAGCDPSQLYFIQQVDGEGVLVSISIP